MVWRRLSNVNASPVVQCPADAFWLALRIFVDFVDVVTRAIYRQRVGQPIAVVVVAALA